MDLQYGRLRRDPQIALIVSLVFGLSGFDRIYVGQTGLGIAKLLTVGGLFVWMIMDWFLIRGAAAAANTEALREIRQGLANA